MIGPIAAFLLLEMVPGGYRFVLVLSFSIALLGVGLITLLVDKPQVAATGTEPVVSALRL